MTSGRHHYRYIFIPLIIFLFHSMAFSQDLFRPKYPDRIYKNMESFLAKEPTSRAGIKAVEDNMFEDKDYSRWNWNDSVPDHCTFQYLSNGFSIRNVFAISYRGFLYFNNIAMTKKKNRIHGDADQYPEMIRGYSRVTMGGSNFWYTDLVLNSKYGYGVAAQGGTTAIRNMTRREKGVVFDWKRNHFNIFTNCEDMNEFMEAFYPEGVVECVDRSYDITVLRQKMKRIIQ